MVIADGCYLIQSNEFGLHTEDGAVAYAWDYTEPSDQHLQAGEEEQDPDGEENQSHGKAVGISTQLTKRHTVLASPMADLAWRKDASQGGLGQLEKQF